MWAFLFMPYQKKAIAVSKESNRELDSVKK